MAFQGEEAHVCGPAGSSSKPPDLSWKDERGGLSDVWVREKGLCGPPFSTAFPGAPCLGTLGTTGQRAGSDLCCISQNLVL